MSFCWFVLCNYIKIILKCTVQKHKINYKLAQNGYSRLKKKEKLLASSLLIVKAFIVFGMASYTVLKLIFTTI